MQASFGVRSWIALVATAAAIAGCSGGVRVGDELGEGDQGAVEEPGGIVDPDGDAPQVGDPESPPPPPPGCGNGVCTPDESCDSCPTDCGACPACGDAVCDPVESCASCSADCGACPGCGNGVCTPNESCGSCPADCGACPCAHDTCATGEALELGCSPCVDQICAVDAFCCDVAWDALCVSEVGSICGTPCAPTCGDGLCDVSESCSTCSQDCGACPTCGDGWCDVNESCSTCSQDCGACAVCGDGVCAPGESCSSCAGDCGACVCHDTCQVGPALDPTCGSCVDQICAVDPFCCQASWDAICVSEVGSICGTPCAPTCGDGLCDPASESCSTCSQDCGTCAVCGDGVCDWTEDCSTCSQDCGACAACGDGVCSYPEDCSTCSQDCGACPSCGDGVCSGGEGCATCSADCGACPACPGLDLGSSIPTSITGNTSGASSALAAPCAPSDAPELTYSFTAPADGTYTIDTMGSTYDTVLYAFDGSCQGAVLGCNDDTNGLQSQLVLGLAAGQTIVIVVDGFGNQQGAFTLNIH